MKRSNGKTTKDKYDQSDWLLDPARTRETIIEYSIIFLLIIGLAYILI